MKGIRLKKLGESISYDYAVCDIEECEREGTKLSATETRFIDLCEYHYRKYILEEK